MKQDTVQSDTAAASASRDHPGSDDRCSNPSDRVMPDSTSAHADSVKQAFTTLRDKLLAGRQPVERSEQYAYPRGWNGALDFVDKCIKEVLGEK